MAPHALKIRHDTNVLPLSVLEFSPDTNDFGDYVSCTLRKLGVITIAAGLRDLQVAPDKIADLLANKSLYNTDALTTSVPNDYRFPLALPSGALYSVIPWMDKSPLPKNDYEAAREIVDVGTSALALADAIDVAQKAEPFVHCPEMDGYYMRSWLGLAVRPEDLDIFPPLAGLDRIEQIMLGIQTYDKYTKYSGQPGMLDINFSARQEKTQRGISATVLVDPPTTAGVIVARMQTSHFTVQTHEGMCAMGSVLSNSMLKTDFSNIAHSLFVASGAVTPPRL